MKEFAATHTNPFHISCGAIAIRENADTQEVALLYRGSSFSDADTWHLPAGTLHTDESLFSCVKREAMEEAGLSVEPKEYVGALHRQFVDEPSGRKMDKITHYFLVDVLAENGTKDVEHDEFVWTEIEKAKTLLSGHPFKHEEEVLSRLNK